MLISGRPGYNWPSVEADATGPRITVGYGTGGGMSLTQNRQRDHPVRMPVVPANKKDDPMSIAILKALGLLKPFLELLGKLYARVVAWRRSRRRARQQRAQSVGRVAPRRKRPWIARRVDRPWIDRRTDRPTVATSADDVLLRPAPGHQPVASLTTRPVLTKDLIRR
jgi:hypothetical protein